MILSGNPGLHLLMAPWGNLWASRWAKTCQIPSVKVQVGSSSKGPPPAFSGFLQMPLNRCKPRWTRLRDLCLHNKAAILAICPPGSINIVVFEPLGPVEFTSMLSRSLHWASAWSVARRPGDSYAFMCSQAQAALAPGGASPLGTSVSVNLTQQADIPVGSVTVHACVMMPGWQVTRVHRRGGE